MLVKIAKTLTYEGWSKSIVTDAIKSLKIGVKWQKLVLWDIYLFQFRSENFDAL